MEWKLIKDGLPDNRQECYLVSTNGIIFGPVPYIAEQTIWLDIFATAEAGTMYRASDKHLLAWIDAESFAVDGEPWVAVKDALPDQDEALCYLVGETAIVVGPATWHSKSQRWGDNVPPTTPGLLRWCYTSALNIPTPEPLTESPSEAAS